MPLCGLSCNQNSNKVEFQFGPSAGVYISDMVSNIRTTKFSNYYLYLNSPIWCEGVVCVCIKQVYCVRVSKRIKFFGMGEHYPPGPLYVCTEPPKKLQNIRTKTEWLRPAAHLKFLEDLAKKMTYPRPFSQMRNFA